MATILNEKKSDGGSPYIFYTIDASVSNRKVNSIDVSYTVTSHLQYSSSSLNTGKLTSYITLNGTEYALTLKTSSQHWSGTTRHTSSNKVTVTGLSSSQTALDNIKFRVTRESGGTSGRLGSTSCSNLTIPIGHIAPTNVSYTIEETNQKLINAQLPETTWVKNLSQKKITLSYTLHDNASVEFYGYADTYTMYGKKNNPFISTSFDINKDSGTNNKVTVYGYIEDSLGAIGKSNSTRYDFIEYIETLLNESTTRVNRNGQLSGRAKLNIKGSFFNGIIGNKNQSGNYKPTIKYKYWKLNDQEPETFDNIISADNITISNNTFTVNDLEIGSSDETAANHFNPDYAYRVKIYVEDNFTSYTSQEKPIPVGEATWTEYKDRVDFKKITIKNKNEFFYEPGDTFESDYDTILNGYVTSGTKNVRLAFPVPKRLDNINSITIESLNAEARCNKGYLNGQSGTVEYVGNSGYTIGVHKSNNNVVNILIIKNSVWTNVDNNTPVVFVVGAGGIKLTFNS